MIDWALDQISKEAIWALVVVGMIVVVAVVSHLKNNCYRRVPEKSAHNMNEVSDANILFQAMATTGFWIKVAFILVFGGGWFACYWAATKAEHDGNRRRAIILGIAGIAIAIAGFVIEDHFDIFSDDDDDDEMALVNDNGQTGLFYPCGAKCPQLAKVL